MTLTVFHISQFEKVLNSFCLIEKDVFESLKKQCYFRELKKKEYFSESGERSKEIGFVLEGVLRNFHLSSDGEEHNKNFLVPNDFFAANITPNQKSIINIQALTAVQLLCIDFASYHSLAQKHRSLSSVIQSVTEAHFEEKQKREIQLLSKNAEENYASFLRKYPKLLDKIPHYHIASYLGITPTQLSRIRKKSNHQHM
jgi:CRP-like cAMP-binding protein